MLGTTLLFLVGIGIALQGFPRGNLPSAQGSHDAHRALGILCLALVAVQARGVG